MAANPSEFQVFVHKAIELAAKCDKFDIELERELTKQQAVVTRKAEAEAERESQARLKQTRPSDV